jgi:UDP-N-acetylglucosamine--N-acetylmuramyl-(pentapeptide) pyrophosphoryl-undecaprenol N-acetylglucosamine transferase
VATAPERCVECGPAAALGADAHSGGASTVAPRQRSAKVSTLLVASTGGHLKQLHHLHRRLSSVDAPFCWATFDTPQSRSLLGEESVDFVRFVGGRDPINVVRNLRAARQILKDREVDTVVSTGSAIALPFFALATTRRLTCHYIESAARSHGPSITGRLISRIPRARLYSQYPSWAGNRWSYGGSVFDAFEPAASPSATPSRVQRAVVTLGTFRGYGFPRLLRRLREVLPSDAEVLWQTGDTDTSGLGISGHDAIPERDLIQAMGEADVVISHAGVGTALAALEVGICPLLVPRRLSYGEHVDDHQTQIASELHKRGLAISVEADDLTYDDLLTATRNRVTTLDVAPPFNTR